MKKADTNYKYETGNWNSKFNQKLPSVDTLNNLNPPKSSDIKFCYFLKKKNSDESHIYAD